jgi:hypothetical protein
MVQLPSKNAKAAIDSDLRFRLPGCDTKCPDGPLPYFSLRLDITDQKSPQIIFDPSTTTYHLKWQPLIRPQKLQVNLLVMVYCFDL